MVSKLEASIPDGYTVTVEPTAEGAAATTSVNGSATVAPGGAAALAAATADAIKTRPKTAPLESASAAPKAEAGPGRYRSPRHAMRFRLLFLESNGIL